MSVAEIIGVVVLVLVALAIGGAIAQRRRLEATESEFADHVQSANLDLAAAHAEDRGWEPGGLERTARAALAEQRPQARITDLTLVQVVDAAGTEDDRAVFRAQSPDGAELHITLARRGGGWYAERVEG